MLRSHDDIVHAVAFHPTGTLLATASEDQNALLWDTEHLPHLKPVARLDHTHPVTALAFSPDGQILATASGTATTLWNAATVTRR
jgi:WD40 repeat protein